MAWNYGAPPAAKNGAAPLNFRSGSMNSFGITQFLLTGEE
jgi:hypothetical protein